MVDFQFLLKHGADIEGRTDARHTPLHFAAVRWTSEYTKVGALPFGSVFLSILLLTVVT